jgi:hypothetical protein
VLLYGTAKFSTLCFLQFQYYGVKFMVSEKTFLYIVVIILDFNVK